MVMNEEIKNEEKKSLSFVEQLVESDLAEGKTEEEYKHVFRLSQTDTYT